MSFYANKPWRTLRRKVIARDFYRCTQCGTSVKDKGQARVDHIKPRETHPELELDITNCRTLCPDCDNQSHREKGLRYPTAQREERIDIRGCDINGMPLSPTHRRWN